MGYCPSSPQSSGKLIRHDIYNRPVRYYLTKQFSVCTPSEVLPRSFRDGGARACGRMYVDGKRGGWNMQIERLISSTAHYLKDVQKVDAQVLAMPATLVYRPWRVPRKILAKDHFWLRFFIFLSFLLLFPGVFLVHAGCGECERRSLRSFDFGRVSSASQACSLLYQKGMVDKKKHQRTSFAKDRSKA